ncbi:aminotransferase [Natribacillus halophilus]|uniref:Aminotransferase n=1 Tax=Natribacillus halophilus TaxID=549003 RepID=A0A1G8NPK9_9BACI|nr:aminotransferase [Natribacillus halophilus]SDI81450.1 aminotransferase [Natribacillus halophilus]
MTQSSLHTTTRKKRLSKTVSNIEPSGIRRFFDLASTMEDCISLGVGEPDFVTPWNVREACMASLEQGYTSYTSNAGMPELRQAITDYMDERFQVSYDPEQEVIVTVGASEAIDLAVRATIDPGDEVLVATPAFVSYEPLVTLSGAVPVPVKTDASTDFKLTKERLEAAITERSRAIVLSFPNNPTGAVMSKRELEAIAEVAEAYDLLIFSDEIYAELSYDIPHTAFSALERMHDRTVLISGFSKAFAMTGWRLGFVCAPADIAQAMLKIHQYALMCAPTQAQHGALEALRNGREAVEKMTNSYRARRNYTVHALNEAGLNCHLPGGSFYAFPSVEATGMDDETFAEQLLIEEKVAVVPGSVFGKGGEGHVRCSYATSLDSLQTAFARMEAFVSRHGK